MKAKIVKQLAKILLIVLPVIFLASCENPHSVEATSLYTVKFETNGGTSIDSYRTNRIESMPQSSKTGHYLSAWHLHPNLSDTSVQFPFDVTGLTTLYAEWTPITYTVSFDSKKGSAVQQQIVDYGKTATKPENPTREKTEFIGWFTTDTYESEFDFASPILSDITLYAKWQVESRTVVFNFNNENKTETKVVEYLSVLEIPSVPTKTGYSFVGWYTDSDLQTLYDFSQPVTSNFSLYAKWTLTSYAITYNLNGGTNDSVNPASYTIETETFALNAPTRIGYAFGGWYETNDFSGNSVTTIAAGSTGNRTLYARWIQDKNLIVVASDEVDNLDVSALTRWKTLIITGEISPATLTTLATKIKGINSDIHLDLSVTTGLTEISGLESQSSIFEECMHLKSIVLPNTLETIGSYAFYFCTSLTNITIPDSVTSIGDYAFTLCRSLTRITIPNGVTSIGDYAFMYCRDLTSITIPDSVASIGSDAFSGCWSLTYIIIPDGVTSIGSDAFKDCTELKSIRFFDTSTWYYTSNSNYTGGTLQGVGNPDLNAAYFTSTYKDKYWYKE